MYCHTDVEESIVGVESYLLRLRGRRSDVDSAVEYAQNAFGLAPDPEQTVLSNAYSYSAYRDGLHVIEFEYFRKDARFEISIRFALCNPSSIDQVFLGIVRSLMKKFDMTAQICEQLPKGEQTEYSVTEEDRFSANYSWSVEKSRERWRQMFGTEQAGLSVSNALQRFLIK
jgi:hypothetical protein